MENKTYVLGNVLRGWYEGRFSSIDEAWSFLSRRFMIGFPTVNNTGRSVAMYVMEPNSYGLMQNVKCKEDFCEINELPAEEILSRVVYYRGFALFP